MGLWRESNPRHLHPKQVFYHLTTKPCYYIPNHYSSFIFILTFYFTIYLFTLINKQTNKLWASPGIEPGPLAPETSILPLNYEAFYPTIKRVLSFYFSFIHFLYIFLSSKKKKKGTIGFEPMTTGTAVLCSTTELCALLLPT